MVRASRLLDGLPNSSTRWRYSFVSDRRDSFLARVRQAVGEGNRPGVAPPLPSRGHVGYQGAGADPLARLQAEFTAAGGFFHLVPDAAMARRVIRRLLAERSAQRVLIGDGAFVDSLDLQKILLDDGLHVERVADLGRTADREAFFAADVGISGVDQVIAETGTIVQCSRHDQPRSLTLLVPIHVAVARREEILPDLFDLFEGPARPATMPGCLTLVTGPSKTGDIELRLVTGVHGPGEVHLVVVAPPGDHSPT